MIYQGQTQKVPFVYTGHMPSSASGYRMRVDCPSVTMKGANGTGRNYWPDSQIVLDWIFNGGLYPSSSTTYDVAKFNQNDSRLNIADAGAFGGMASHSIRCLSSAPTSELAYSGYPKPYRPWSNTGSPVYGSLPNHGDQSVSTTGPCYVAFNRSSSYSNEEYYIGNYSSVIVTQRLFLAGTNSIQPTVMNFISMSLLDTSWNEPLMFWGMAEGDYMSPQANYFSQYKKRFTVPADSEYGIATEYTYFEDSVTFNFNNAQAASVAPWLVIGAPGFAFNQGGVSGQGYVQVIRGSLGIHFNR